MVRAISVVVVVPDVVQDFFSGEGDSLVFEEVGEEFEYLQKILV